MKEKLINFVKTNKKTVSIVLGIVLVFLILLVIVCNSKKVGYKSGNLENLGFTANLNGTIYYVGLNEGENDGLYKLNGKNKTKISDDFGYYLNVTEKNIYYFDAIDKSIVKMKTNRKR